MDAEERMQAKINDVVLRLHDDSMDPTASHESRTFARLKKQVMPPLLEFIKDETLRNRAKETLATEIASYIIIIFAETLAAFVHAYHAQGTPNEIWAQIEKAMELIFLETLEHHIEQTNGIQSNKTDRPAQV